MGGFTTFLIVLVALIVLIYIYRKYTGFRAKTLKFRYFGVRAPRLGKHTMRGAGDEFLTEFGINLLNNIIEMDYPLLCYMGRFRMKFRTRPALLIQDEKRKLFTYAIFEEKIGRDSILDFVINLPGNKNKAENLIRTVEAIITETWDSLTDGDDTDQIHTPR